MVMDVRFSTSGNGFDLGVFGVFHGKVFLRVDF
jgi:hypothetical protein